MPERTGPHDLHAACYFGELDLVRAHLDAGDDPNDPASPAGEEWISAAGPRPKPLNCVSIAPAMTAAHIDIARLLIRRGAVVDDTVLQDHTAEMVGGAADQALRAVLETARRRSVPSAG